MKQFITTMHTQAYCFALFNNETIGDSDAHLCSLCCGDAGLWKQCCTIQVNLTHVASCWQVVLSRDIPWLGHELPCHLVVWHSGRRRITTIPQRWPTSMTWDKLLNREYICFVLLRSRYRLWRNALQMWCLFRLFNREEFCEIFRAKDRNTLKMYTCKKFHKKDGRKVRKAAKNEIMVLKM